MPQLHHKFDREEFKLKTIKMLLAEDKENGTDLLGPNEDVITGGYSDMLKHHDESKSEWFIYEDSLFNINEFKFDPRTWCFVLPDSLGEFKLLPTKFGYIEIWM